jgi:DNA-binding MarR family transcriptional regulator
MAAGPGWADLRVGAEWGSGHAIDFLYRVDTVAAAESLGKNNIESTTEFMAPMQDRHTDPAIASEIAETLDRLGRAAHALQFFQGLNPAQWEALRFLGRANRYSRSPSCLADYLGTTKGTTSQTLRALESKGYVTRCRDCNDRRGVSLELTEEGKKLLADDPLRDIERAVASLPVDCATQLAKGLTKVLANIRGSCGQSEFGVCARCNHLIPLDETGTARCGLTAEALSKDDAKQLCATFSSGTMGSSGAMGDGKPAAAAQFPADTD